MTSEPAPRLSVVDYDPAWPSCFDEIRRALEPVLAGIAATVEHVGSTAVPGLPAKPIVDIDVVVESTDDVLRVLDRLESIGYERKGDRGVEGREALAPPAQLPFHHPYVVVRGSKAHLDHVLLRDFLRADPSAAAEYAAEKRRHAPFLGSDRARYTDAKSDLVEAMLQRASEAAGVRAAEPALVDGIDYRWRAPIAPEVIDDLVSSAFAGPPSPGWWRRVRPRSLGGVTAHDGDELVGFVNVVTDGALHAFLLDTAVRATHRRRGIGTRVVRRAAERARAADCEWLHVDYEEALSDFYIRACGFRTTAAGVIRLTD